LKIENQKQLRQLIKLCRDTGVLSISVDGITLELGSISVAPKQARRRSSATVVETSDGTQDVSDLIDMPDELTQEQLLMWSSASGGQTVTPGEGQ